MWRGPDESGRPIVLSCWKLTQEEMDEVKKTGRIWLWLWGQTMQPAAIGGKHPWNGPPVAIKEGKIIKTGEHCCTFEPEPTVGDGEQLQLNYETMTWRVICKPSSPSV